MKYCGISGFQTFSIHLCQYYQIETHFRLTAGELADSFSLSKSLGSPPSAAFDAADRYIFRFIRSSRRSNVGRLSSICCDRSILLKG